MYIVMLGSKKVLYNYEHLLAADDRHAKYR